MNSFGNNNALGDSDTNTSLIHARSWSFKFISFLWCMSLGFHHPLGLSIDVDIANKKYIYGFVHSPSLVTSLDLSRNRTHSPVSSPASFSWNRQCKRRDIRRSGQTWCVGGFSAIAVPVAVAVARVSSLQFQGPTAARSSEKVASFDLDVRDQPARIGSAVESCSSEQQRETRMRHTVKLYHSLYLRYARAYLHQGKTDADGVNIS